MQTPGAPETHVSSATQQGVAAIDEANAADPAHRWEQQKLLFIGFGAGMLVAGIFLAYIVLAAAAVLP